MQALVLRYHFHCFSPLKSVCNLLPISTSFGLKVYHFLWFLLFSQNLWLRMTIFLCDGSLCMAPYDLSY